MVSFKKNKHTRDTAAATTRYQAGAIGLLVIWIRYVATRGVVPPNTARAALYENDKALTRMLESKLSLKNAGIDPCKNDVIKAMAATAINTEKILPDVISKNIGYENNK